MGEEVPDSTGLRADAEAGPSSNDMAEEAAGRERIVTRLRRLWDRRQAVWRSTGTGLVLSTLIAFLIPKRFESSAHLMPPDQPNAGIGMALLAGSANNAGSNLGSIAGGLLGLKSSGALFIGILQSRTVQDDILNKFQLQKVYKERYAEDARKDLARNSAVFEDRKSGIITIQVTDKDAVRATAIAQEYTAELNRVVNQMSTSSAHREREFLEERLKAVQLDLADAEKDFSQFSSKSGAIDIREQGKAMIGAAATLQGQLIAAQSELQGLKQIYTSDNVRVRSVQAQISEWKTQLDKIGGENESAASLAHATQSGSNYPTIRRLPLLGVMYAEGTGGPKDDVAARAMFEKAAAQNHAEALDWLGNFVLSGRGGPQDTKAAKGYYEKAAALGNEDAKAALRRLDCSMIVKDRRGNVLGNLCF